MIGKESSFSKIALSYSVLARVGSRTEVIFYKLFKSDSCSIKLTLIFCGLLTYADFMRIPIHMGWPLHRSGKIVGRTEANKLPI